MLGESCSNCRFYVALSNQCRRQPPVPLPMQSGVSMRVAGMWPAVGATDWCGEWQQSKVVDAKLALPAGD